jgi:hypothetical protein
MPLQFKDSFMIRVFTPLALLVAVISTSGCVCGPLFDGIWCTPEPSEQVTPINTPSGGDESNSGAQSEPEYNGPGAT